MSDIYRGYKEIKGNTEYINNTMSDVDFISSFVPNEYLIISNEDDGSIKEMRFDGNTFVTLKLPPQKIVKGKNSLQRCAIDLLNNNNITIVVILGYAGSGKTHLSMKMALYHVKDKGDQSSILGVREAVGEGKEVGFLPGSLEDKTDLFFAPLVDQLEGGIFQFEELKQSGVLESNIPFYLKGRTFKNTIILVDEAEDLTNKQIKLIGTRVGENGRIIFSGDYKQSIIDNSSNNSLIKMCNEFRGDPMFGCIYLDEDVRSLTSKKFAQLFEGE